MALQSISPGGTVSSLRPPVNRPVANADTITNALAPFPNSGAKAVVRGAAETGFFTYPEPSCGSGVVQGAGVGSQLVGAGLGSVPVVGGVLKTVFGAFGAHHAAAVKLEQATLCDAVPAANNFLRQIDAAVIGGQISTATATQAMEQAFTQWRGQVGKILKDTGGKCNAACVYEKCFRAAIEKRKLDYSLRSSALESAGQGVIGGAVSAVTNAVSTLFGAFTGAVPTKALPISAGQPVAGAAVGADSHSLGAAPVSASTVLQQAGLTSANQGSLAAVLLIGGLLLSVVVFSKFSGGGSK